MHVPARVKHELLHINSTHHKTLCQGGIRDATPSCYALRCCDSTRPLACGTRDQQLRNWARRQRESVAFKKRRISRKWTNTLSSIGFCFDGSIGFCLSTGEGAAEVEELRPCKLEHDRAAPRRTEGELSKWVAQQRAEHGQGRLPQEQV